MVSSPDVDREVVKYLIFHELLHGNGYWNHDEASRKREWQYPNLAQLDGFLDSLALEYNLDDLMKKTVVFETPDMNIQSDRPVEQSNQNIQGQSEPLVFNPYAAGIQTGFNIAEIVGVNFLQKLNSVTDAVILWITKNR